MKNMRYAKLLPDQSIAYADSIIHGKYGFILNPSDEEYELNGFFKVEDSAPTVSSTQRIARAGWKLDGNTIRAIYQVLDVERNVENEKEDPNAIQRLLRSVAYKLLGIKRK